MRAVTLWQPWAGAMASQVKRLETRGRLFLPLGERVAIHAGTFNAPMELWSGLPESIHDIPDALRVRGSVLAVCVFTWCGRTEKCIGLSADERALGNYFPGRWAFRAESVRALATPVPCRGMQGLWTLPSDVEQLVLEQLGEV